jgi:hypothetical protein
LTKNQITLNSFTFISTVNNEIVQN